jgi:hypothetical protein
MNSKYFPNITIVDWFIVPSKLSKVIIVSKALVGAFNMVGGWMVWKFRNGRSILSGEDR